MAGKIGRGLRVRRLLQTFGKFLRAEEVPRWFGLSVVLIYVVGLGTIAQYGIAQARREASVQFLRDSQFAVLQLADRIAGSGAIDITDAAWISRSQRAMRDFVADGPAQSVRLVQGDRILASTNPTEVDTIRSEKIVGEVQPSGLELAIVHSPSGEKRSRLIRSPLAVRSNQNDGANVVLEAITPVDPMDGATMVSHARLWSIVLAVLGALFVVYRCLREQLRGVSRIANRLEIHRDRIQDGLSSLRISDSMDHVTTAWNQLVDLAERLSEAVQRTEANEELSRVLQKSGGGALAEALNAVPDGIIHVAEDSRVVYANATACRVMGWNAQEIRRKLLADVEANGAGRKVLELIRASATSDGGFDARTEVVDPEHPERDDASTFRVLVIPITRARQQGECIVLIRDVSQQLRSDRAREEFIAQVTHELRTPLTNIRAYTETLSSGMFDDPKVVTECYNVITKETRRLARLVEDMLSVSQLEVGSIALKVDQVDLKTLLSEGVRDVRGLAEEKNIDLQIVLPAKMEPLKGDRDKLAVVVNNLLGNAIKYTPANGNVVLGCQFAAESVVITVKDNGIGIDPTEHGKVFEKFQRGSNPEVQSETGTGIGLYTAREIVRRHGGDIELMSERNKGATFVVRLPRAESRAGALTTTLQGAATHG